MEYLHFKSVVTTVTTELKRLQ